MIETALVILKEHYASPEATAKAGQCVRMSAARAADLVKGGHAEYAQVLKGKGVYPEVEVQFPCADGWDHDEPPSDR